VDKKVLSQLESIKTDNVNGAEALAKKSAELFRWIAERGRPRSAEEFTGIIRATAKALVNAQPAMAGIFNLANAMLIASEDVREIARMRSVITSTAERFLDSSAEHTKKIAAKAGRLIHSGQTIATHSFSSTVFQSLLAAKESGATFNVICTESRPMMEGVALARSLANSRIPVALVTDAGVGATLERADIVLVGADSIGLEGLVNKAGTMALAAAARRFKLPCYALCSTNKFVPPSCRVLHEKEGDPREILRERAANVTPRNFYFDLTPLEYLSGVLTEHGLLRGETIKKRIRNLKVHPFLR